MNKTRWEQQVVKAGCYNDVTGPYTVKLLARQHAAVVRMVKRVAKEYESTLEESSAEHLRDDILAALATRGGKK